MKSKRENIIIITLIAAVLFILFGADWRPEYSTDTIDLAERGFFALARQFFENGRAVTALMMAVWGFFGKGIPTLYVCNWAGGLIFMGASAFIMQRQFADEVKNPVERTLIALLLFINPFVIEFFMFIETASFCMSMFCVTLAVVTYSKFMSTGKVRFIPITLGILFVSAFSYQSVAGLFICIMLPFNYIYSKARGGIGIYIRNLAIALVIYGIPLLANLLQLKFVVGNARVDNTASDIGSRSNIIISYLQTMKKVPGYIAYSFGIFPDKLSLWIVIICTAAALIALILGKKKKDVLSYINLAAILLVIPTVSTASITMGPGWYMPRIVYPLGSLLGVLLLNIRMNIIPGSKPSKSDKRAGVILIACMVVYLFISMVCFTKIIAERYQMNACDRARSLSVQHCIEKYEEKSGVTVKNIAVYNDGFSAKPYGISDERGMTASSFATVWSDVAGINFYAGQSYSRVERDPKYTEYFKGKKWNCFSEEQLVFDGDTLHMCLW